MKNLLFLYLFVIHILSCMEKPTESESSENNIQITNINLSNSSYDDYLLDYNYARKQILFRRSGLYPENLWVMNNDGTNQKQLTTQSGRIDFGLYSMDGEFVFTSLWYNNSTPVVKINLTSNEKKYLTNYHSVPIGISADGNRLLIRDYSANGSLANTHIFYIDTNKDSLISKIGNSIPLHMSKNGNQIYYYKDRMIMKYDLLNSKVDTLYHYIGITISTAYSNDDSTAVISDGSNLKIVNLSTKKAINKSIGYSNLLLGKYHPSKNIFLAYTDKKQNDGGYYVFVLNNNGDIIIKLVSSIYAKAYQFVSDNSFIYWTNSQLYLAKYQ